ncbi:MAG: TatD family hydrolase, partial [Synergistaceae bacterium]|nr:TatD family hydrolase [Synergistaceae bacterium]
APFRGKINEPCYIKYVYELIANIKNLEFSELEDRIKNNYKKFFEIK